ncbi:MAG: pyridoxamine 5-phosphate oxidase-related protein, FMN-binding [Deltaproteobacteria bacterium]|nr:pyridoxamine 5-phosphate oxidase-related protein, FMN-binding [Deltaproteobacteria bacterium]
MFEEGNMTLSEYFEKTQGRCVLATADARGMVDLAIYSRPHVIDEENIAFIMLDRLSHVNLQSNPHAAFLFMEAGEKYVGKRLFLTKTKEEDDQEVIEKFRRKKSYELPDDDKKKRFLVYFHVDKVLPLIGDHE